jgi:hypothetical protein
VGSLFILIGFAAAVAVFFLHQAWRSARSLHRRGVAELDQLKRALAARHLILSHLLDSLPDSPAPACDHTRDRQTLQQAVTQLQSIDETCPRTAQILKSAECERNLTTLLEELVKRIDEDGLGRQSQLVSACLRALDDSNRRIRESLSTYNTAVITHEEYLARPVTALVARLLPTAPLRLFDLIVGNVGDSSDSTSASGLGVRASRP